MKYFLRQISSVDLMLIRVAFFLLITNCVAFGQLEVYQDSLDYYIARKNDVKSLLYYDKVLALVPNSTYYLLRKGILLSSQSKDKEAVKLFSRTLEIKPDINEAWYRRGISYLNLKKYDSCLADLNTVYGKSKRLDSLIFAARGLAYLNTQQFELAKNDFDSAISISPKEVYLYNNRAFAKQGLGDSDGAIEDLNHAIAIDKDYMMAYRNRAIVYFQLNLQSEAFADANVYLRKFPDDVELNVRAGLIYFDRKDYQKSASHLNKLTAPEGYGKIVHFVRGTSNYFLANDIPAIDDLRCTLEYPVTQEEEAEIYLMIGICRNNLKPKSGCADITTSIKKGHAEAQRIFKDECE